MSNNNQHQIRYDLLVQKAMRGVIRDILAKTRDEGLPGEHHFYIVFNTQAPGVEISTRLQQQYPEEMTIVMQHQYWDFEVKYSHFSVKLSFNGITEPLFIPYNAIKAFVDPSVPYGFQLTPIDDEPYIQDNRDVVLEDESKKTSHDSLLREVLNSEDHFSNIESGQDNVKPAFPLQSSTGALSHPPKISAVKKADKDVSKKEDSKKETSGADVVQLDAFRKKS